MKINTINKIPLFSQKSGIDRLVLTKRIEGNMFPALNQLATYYLAQDDKVYPIDEMLKPKAKEQATKEKISRVYSQIMNVVKFSTTEYEQIRQQDKIKKIIQAKIKRGYSPIVNIENISIYQSEIDFIKGIENLENEKLLFSILCYIKFTQKKYKQTSFWCNYKFSLLFKSAGLRYNQQEQVLKIGELIEQEYLKSNYRVDALSFYASFMENLQQKGKEYKIDNFDELGMIYLELTGTPMKHCVHCGRRVKNLDGKEWVLCNSCKRLPQYKDYKQMRRLFCDNCGVAFLVAPNNKTQHRCENCQKEYTRKLKTEKQKEYRSQR